MKIGTLALNVSLRDRTSRRGVRIIPPCWLHSLPQWWMPILARGASPMSFRKSLPLTWTSAR